ncbi:AAA family ATPase [Methyloferula stellata]|uniref:AAA family ATPase n=1 Tax=Methyloferula stellata TaxID=876270 RepID=UPI00035DC957|nr:MoxR family ATPase [Methyloferula stellata]
MRLERDTRTTLDNWRQLATAFQAELARVVIGQERVIKLVTIAVFARGHVLLEGDVGVGKTTLLRAVARAIGGAYERVEGTIDLMPSDLVYHTYLAEDGRPRVDAGPVLRSGEALSVFFFNEINRARPQVHSLLLRLMAEASITAFNREHYFPYLQVFADRNRVEKEETFELPAAARDRFFMEIGVQTPDDPEVRRRLAFDPRFHDVDALISTIKEGVLDHRELGSVAKAIQENIHASKALEDYVLALWQGLHRPAATGISLPDIDMDRLVQGGASPRGMSFLVRAARVHAWLAGRDMVIPEDIRDIFIEIVGHRIFLDPIYELRRQNLAHELCDAVFAKVPVP